LYNLYTIRITFTFAVLRFHFSIAASAFCVVPKKSEYLICEPIELLRGPLKTGKTCKICEICGCYFPPFIWVPLGASASAASAAAGGWLPGA
jgi:hypothetical protein